MLDGLTRVSSHAQILQHLFSVRMKKVLEEVSDRLIGDVPTHHYVTPGKNGRHGKSQQLSHPLSFLKAPPYLLRCPSNSMISGMAEAKRARPTVRKSTWKGRVVAILSAKLFSCLECATKGGHAVDVSVADGGHGHHQKVDTVPVGEDLPVVKVWRVTRVFQKMNWNLIGW